MAIVSPSILNVDSQKRPEIVKELLENGINWIHYDVMDGIFVHNIAISFDNYKEIVSSNKIHTKDIHLMVNDPIKYLDIYLHKAEYLTFHFEALSYSDIYKIIKKYRNKENQKIGIAIKPETNVEQIYEFISEVDLILIMAVNPGAGGQIFIESTYDKIAKIKKFINERSLNTIIQIDGGINDITGPICAEKGADILVCGSYLIKNISKDRINSISQKD